MAQHVSADSDNVRILPFADRTDFLLHLHQYRGPISGGADCVHRSDSHVVDPDVELVPCGARMEVERDTAVGADEQDYARFPELLDLAFKRWLAQGSDLVIGQAVGVGDGEFDVVHDILGQAVVPRRIVENLAIVAQVVIKKETFDSRSPVKWPEAHLGGALAEGGDDVGWIFGRGGKASVLEAIHTSG